MGKCKTTNNIDKPKVQSIRRVSIFKRFTPQFQEFPGLLFIAFWCHLVHFRFHFVRSLDFKQCPQIDQHKITKQFVQEGVLKKHVLGMDC